MVGAAALCRCGDATGSGGAAANLHGATLYSEAMPTCTRRLYNGYWDGYRLADMLQSRAQQHDVAGGMPYHLKRFPDSLVARFHHDYMQHLVPGGWKVGARFTELWDMKCTNPRSSSAGGSSSEAESPDRSKATSLADDVWTTGERLSGPCPFPADHPLRRMPRDHRYNLFIPAASALLDMLYRERLATTAARSSGLGDAAAPLWRRTAAVHVRAGEVIDMSPHDVGTMLEKHTRFSASCGRDSASEAGRPWTGTPCMKVQSFEYVMPLPYFELVRQALCAHRIELVVLVAGSALNLTKGFRKSCEYLEHVCAFFARAGFRVAVRLGQPPDDDFRFFSRVGMYVPSGGAYSAKAAAVAHALGVHVVRPNRSLYPSALETCPELRRPASALPAAAEQIPLQ